VGRPVPVRVRPSAPGNEQATFKVAFLLQKLSLMPFGLEGWVRIGCVWVHLVRLIHIRMCLPHYFVSRLHKRKVCMKGYNVHFASLRLSPLRTHLSETHAPTSYLEDISSPSFDPIRYDAPLLDRYQTAGREKCSTDLTVLWPGGLPSEFFG
jgi:hypothetical protein